MTLLKGPVGLLLLAGFVIALDYRMIAAAEEFPGGNWPFDIGDLAYKLVVPCSILAVVKAYAAFGLWKRGEVPSFATGYLIVGAVAAGIAFGIPGVWVFRDYYRWCERLSGPWLERFDDGPLRESLEQGIRIAALAVPQVMAAIVGGGLARLLGFSLVMRKRFLQRCGPTAVEGGSYGGSGG